MMRNKYRKWLTSAFILGGLFFAGGCTRSFTLDGNWEAELYDEAIELTIDQGDVIFEGGEASYIGKIDQKKKTITLPDGKFSYKVIGDKLNLLYET